MKRSQVSVFMQNIRLALFGLGTSLLFILLRDVGTIQRSRKN
jgi:hypothetical protein